MEKKVKTPFLWARITNMIIGFVVLALILAVIANENHSQMVEICIFVLAAAENFISATIAFSEQKRMRANISAVISAVFLVAALIVMVQYIGII